MSRLTLGKGEAASDVSRGTAAKTGRALLINSLALNFPPKTGAEHLLESILEGRGFQPTLGASLGRGSPPGTRSTSTSQGATSQSQIPAAEQQLDGRTLELLKGRKMRKQLKAGSVNRGRKKIKSPIE